MSRDTPTDLGQHIALGLEIGLVAAVPLGRHHSEDTGFAQSLKARFRNPSGSLGSKGVRPQHRHKGGRTLNQALIL